MRFKLSLLAISVSLLLLSQSATAQVPFTATIDGIQEVPAVPTGATGVGTFSFDTTTKMLSFDISFAGLMGNETGAHFHGPAAPGANAGVQFGLPAGSPKVGSVGPLSAAQEADLMAGLWYVNIHSNLYPGGEIRGQVLRQAVSNESGSWGAIKALYEAE